MNYIQKLPLKRLFIKYGGVSIENEESRSIEFEFQFELDYAASRFFFKVFYQVIFLQNFRNAFIVLKNIFKKFNLRELSYPY